MSIVGGLDIHRKQLPFDYLDTASGQVTRGQVTPADREHLRAWLARFAGGDDDAAFAIEGCTGGGTSLPSWPRPESACTRPRGPTRPSPAAASGPPRPTIPTAATCCSCSPRVGCIKAVSSQNRSWRAV